MLHSASSKEVVDYVLSTFVKGAMLQKGCRPGFAHALKLSYPTIDASRVSADEDNSLSYRYKLSPDIPYFTVGLCTALMDELSTDACFRVGRPSAPGLSLHLETQLISPIGGSSRNETLPKLLDPSTKEVDIINVVTKLGKTISFTRTDFRCTKTQNLLAVSSHVKYMPTGSWVLDLIFNNKWVSSLYNRWYVQPATLPNYAEKNLLQDVILPHFDYLGQGKAAFQVTNEHTNPFDGLHGGCHAMTMELAAEAYLKETASGIPILESMHVDYLGAGAKGRVDIECELLSPSSSAEGTDNARPNGHRAASAEVRVLLKQGGRTRSDGILRWRLHSSKL